MDGILRGDAEARFFDEMDKRHDEGVRIVVGGARRSCAIEVAVLATGSADGAARRLYESLWEYLPPTVFDELQQLFIQQKEQT
jgi:hypothetical protein